MAGDAKKLLAAAEQHIRDEEAEDGLQKSTEARALFDKAGETENAAKSLFNMCLGHCLKGEREEANRIAQEQLKVSRDKKQNVAEAHMLLTVAWVNSDKIEGKERDMANECAQQAENMFRELGDKLMEAKCLLVRVNIALKFDGDMATMQANVQEAVTLAGGALLLYRGVGDRRGEANALHWMAEAQHWTRNPEAVENSLEAAKIFKEVGDHVFAANELKQLADWETRNNGDMEQAITAAEESLLLVRERKRANNNREVATLGVVCRAHVARGQVSEAARFGQEGIDRFKELGDKQAIAQTLMMLVQAHFEKLDTDESQAALRFAEEARTVLQELEDKRNLAKICALASLISYRRLDLEKARVYAKNCLSVEESAAFFDKGIAKHVLVGCFLRDKSYEEALKHAQEAQALCIEANQPLREGISLMTTCNVYFQMEDYENALKCAQEAQILFFEEGDKYWEAEAHQSQAEVHQARTHHQAAVRSAEKAGNVWKSLNDGGALAYALVLAAQNQALLVAKMQETNADKPSTQRIDIKAAARKALKLATDGKGIAKAIGEEKIMASALCAVAQAEVFDGKYNQALDAIEEAMKICRTLGDNKLLANTLILSAKTRIVAGWPQEAPDEAAEALTLFRHVSDARGEALAMNLLQQIKDENLEVLGGRRAVPRREDAPTGAAPSQQVSTAAAPGGAVQKSAGLTEEAVTASIQEVTRKLIGGTKDLDLDRPLMEAGVTSMTAILYRQNLADALEGVNFPVTLVFDYPTIGAISDLVLEQGARLGGSDYPGA